MSDGLALTIERTQENPENGSTSFAIPVGYLIWHLTLKDVAQLFDRYGAQEHLLMMEVGEKREIVMTACLREKKAE